MEPAPRKQMRRRELSRDARFITFSCEGRLPLLRSDRAAALFVECLYEVRAEHGFGLLAWVVMPEHVHLIARPAATRSLGSSLRSIKSRFAKRLIANWSIEAPRAIDRLRGRRGAPRVWLAGGGFDRSIRDHSELTRELQYIHRNPAERGLAKDPHDWRWSSLHWWARSPHCEWECDEPIDPGWRKWCGYV
ncbi:MAG: transposase [Planctomycetota bacterium]|nr:transposase [Planctomycetota bacterium]